MSESEFKTTDKYIDTWEYTRMVHRYGLSEFPPAIVACAITGGNHGKEANPNLPETVDEQVQSTYEAYKAGASIVHIHRRLPEDPSKSSFHTDPALFREVNIKIREKCPDIIINDTCGCGAITDAATGMRDKPARASIPAEPEMISLDSSCFCSYMRIKARDGRPEVIRESMYCITKTEVDTALELCAQHGIKPEFECFNMSDLYYVERLIQEGKTHDTFGPYYVNFVFTNASNWPIPDYVSTLVRACPKDALFSITATGAQQWAVLAQALVWGCHVRVGMEDNVYISRGKLAESNGQLVEKIVRMADDVGRRVATPEQARKMLGLGAPRVWN